MDLVTMILQASIAVQLVMLLLVIMSVYVWILVFAKLWQIRGLYKKSKAFKHRFNTSTDLSELYHALTAQMQDSKLQKKVSSLEQIFIVGFKEYVRQNKTQHNDVNASIKLIQNEMRQVYDQQMDLIEERGSNLATIGSAAPYIGLFGTVLGVINAFQGLGKVQHATLALVAPGISEALVATAMGLFVAIPAVMSYNRLQSTTQRLSHYFEDFMGSFSRLIERQLRER
jgi:biopolymer transport protein TolQ